MNSYVSPYQIDSRMVGFPVSGHPSASGDSYCRNGHAPYSRPMFNASPPPGLRRDSVAGSIFNGYDTVPSSPAGMYALASPDCPPSLHVSRHPSGQSTAGSTATPSYMPPCSPYDTGHHPIYVSSRPTPSANTIDGSLFSDSAYYSGAEGVQSLRSRGKTYYPGGSSISPRPSTSSSQVSRATTSPPCGGKRSIAADHSSRQTRERRSWEPVQYVEPHRSDLVHSASSDSSRSAPSSSYRSSHSNRIKKSQQNPTNFFERLQTTRQGLLSRFTGVTASVSGTTHNLKDLYRRFTKY